MKPEMRRAWIEACYRFMGYIPKKGLMDFFGISPAQMSSDIKEIQSHSNRIGGSLKVVAGQFRGSLPDGGLSARIDLAEIIRSGAFGNFSSVDHDLRVICDPDILGKIMTAIIEGQAIELAYTSMTSGSSVKILSPHHIIEAAGRLHFRAYDHGANAFRDFVINRVDRIIRVVTEISAVDASEDHDFRSKKTITIEINPIIPEDRRAMICRDFGLSSDGKRKIRISAAHEIYIKARIGEYSEDYIQPVIIRE